MSDGLNPMISVVIPTHQASALLEQCLHDLMGSTKQPTECNVDDDGSTDDSGRTALRHGATVIKPQARRGPAHARNPARSRPPSRSLWSSPAFGVQEPQRSSP